MIEREGDVVSSWRRFVVVVVVVVVIVVVIAVVVDDEGIVFVATRGQQALFHSHKNAHISNEVFYSIRPIMQFSLQSRGRHGGVPVAKERKENGPACGGSPARVIGARGSKIGACDVAHRSR